MRPTGRRAEGRGVTRKPVGCRGRASAPWIPDAPSLTRSGPASHSVPGGLLRATFSRGARLPPGLGKAHPFSWEGFLSLPLRELSKGELYCGQHLVAVSLQQGNLV